MKNTADRILLFLRWIKDKVSSSILSVQFDLMAFYILPSNAILGTKIFVLINWECEFLF